MKSEEQIKEMLEQYKFDYEATKEFYPEDEDELKKINIKIGILKWVLE
jgi:hypothetical protein